MSNSTSFSQLWVLFGPAVTASLLMAALCGFLGCFIVLRRLSFLSDTLAHGATLGIGLAFLAGIPQSFVLIPFSIGLSLFLSWLSEKRAENLVALTAVAFSLCMGAGILILSRFGAGHQEIEHVLFGDLLWIGRSDLLVFLAAGIPVCAFLVVRFKRLALIFLSADLARAHGIPIILYENLFMVCVGVVIAVCIKLVGVLLVTSLVTVPPLVAARLARTFREQALYSPLIGVGCAALGALFSLWRDLPTGPCIATLAGLLFLLSLLYRPRWG